MRKWLPNNVVFGDPENDSKRAFGDLRVSQRNLGQYLHIAWAKMFPGAGAEHNNIVPDAPKQPNDDEDVLANTKAPAYEVKEENYQDFVLTGKTNDNISFTGWKEWSTQSGALKFFAPIAIPVTIATNTIRLITEGIPYFFEQACRYSIVKMRAWAAGVKDTQAISEKTTTVVHNNQFAAMGENTTQNVEEIEFTNIPRNFGPKKFFAHALISIPILLLATGYYSFKAARLLIRTVTAPVESFRSAWGRNRALGVLSAILSIAAIVFVGAYAAPAALKSLGVVASNLPAVKHGADILNISIKSFWMMSTSVIYVAGNAVVAGLRKLRERAVKKISTANDAEKPPGNILKGEHSSVINFKTDYKAKKEKVSSMLNAFNTDAAFTNFKADHKDLIKRSLLVFPTSRKGTMTFSDNLEYRAVVDAIRSNNKITTKATEALDALKDLLELEGDRLSITSRSSGESARAVQVGQAADLSANRNSVFKGRNGTCARSAATDCATATTRFGSN